MTYCSSFNQIRLADIGDFGGKNASLGEMTQQLSSKGIRVPEGFALNAYAFRQTLSENGIIEELTAAMAQIRQADLNGIEKASETCGRLIDNAVIPSQILQEVYEWYKKIGSPSVAVRSSATAEDLPDASFAGQHESFLNVSGEKELEIAIRNCYRSLYSERAIKYRIDHGFDHESVALSVGIQKMVRSDRGAAGVAFTIDPETGFDNVIYITGAWGLGELVVQGAVNPDEFIVFKPRIELGKNGLLQKKLGSKPEKIVFAAAGLEKTKLVSTTPAERDQFVLNDLEIQQLAAWCLSIEKHYGSAMDIEWAKDGESGDVYIVQARPETVHSRPAKPVIREYSLKERSRVLCTGEAVGHSIISGPARIVRTMADSNRVKNGDIIVAEITHPDWNNLLRKAVCIITDKGGRTSHASIIARELGISAVVGTGNSTRVLRDGQLITVNTAEGSNGIIYDGALPWSVHETVLSSVPHTHVQPMLILADPSRAFRFANYPAAGIGLLRMEFIIANVIRIHPMAVLFPDQVEDAGERKLLEEITRQYPDKRTYFIDQLASSLAIMAAAFYPKEVIVRMSDFKTNEYADLIGGKYFEPHEENPMLGWRGASRYYRKEYKAGFGLECAAIRRVRDTMGFTNIKVMIPFCRTPEEGQLVLDTMKEFGLKQHENGLEVYVMAELPSNVLLAKEFAQIFDGFSIGSNDLTQLVLGVDRDAENIRDLFNENNLAVKMMLRKVIRDVKATGKKIGLCGQAPSDHVAFAKFLVECGIDSISFNPDALIKGIDNIAAAEKKPLLLEPFKQ